MSPVAESLTNIFGLGSQLSRVNNWRIPKLFSSSSAREAGVFLQSGLRAGLHSTTGGSLSSTVTVKAQEAVFPEGSVAAHLTVVTPFGKRHPEAGLHSTAGLPQQLSVAVTLKLTTAPHLPASFGVTMSAGTIKRGSSASRTVTVNVQTVALLEPSVAQQFTVVVPIGKAEPEAGTQTNVIPGMLSLAATEYFSKAA